MPKITKTVPQPHANSDVLNARFVQGVWQSSTRAVKCCNTVACPRCKAGKGWPCFSASGNDSSTPHTARWEAYHAAQATDTGRA